MKLERVSPYKKAIINNLINKGKRIVIGTSLALSLYSSASLSNTASAKAATKEELVTIPSQLRESICNQLGIEKRESVSSEKLKKVKSLFFMVDENNDSFDILNYCPNIRELYICIKTNDSNILKEIPNMVNLESLSIISLNNLEINHNNFQVAFNSPKLRKLGIYGFDIAPGVIESLKQVKKLELDGDMNFDIDFSKMTNLKELDFGLSKPYDLALNFNTDDYNTLISNNVKVTSENNTIETLLKVNKKLDKIVKKLHIDKNSTDREKLDAILVYVLKNLEYDEKVAKKLDKGKNPSVSKFYSEGYLYGALELDSAICGNYASLVEALANRVGLNSYFIMSENHTWNLVEVEGKSYYVDATWLDDEFLTVKKDKMTKSGNMKSVIKNISAQEIIARGLGKKLDWYMVKPNKVLKIDDGTSHVAINYHDYMKDDYEINQYEDITFTKFNLNIDGEKFIVTGGALVGALSALGLAIEVNKKRKNINQYEQNIFYDSDIDYSDEIKRHR